MYNRTGNRPLQTELIIHDERIVIDRLSSSKRCHPDHCENVFDVLLSRKINSQLHETMELKNHWKTFLYNELLRISIAIKLVQTVYFKALEILNK